MFTSKTKKRGRKEKSSKRALAVTADTVHDVLVLGAGSAGLSAARTLHDAGIKDFVILEAEPRIGGRVRHVQFHGDKVEMGAQWIHGQGNNPIYLMAKKYGLKTLEFDYDDWIVRDKDGNDITDEAETVYEELYEAIEKVELKKQKKNKESEPDVSYRSALYSAGWVPNSVAKDVCEWYEFYFDYGISPERIPLKTSSSAINAERYPGNDLLVIDKRGYRHIFVKYAEEFLEKDDPRLKLNQVVTKVEYSNHPNKNHVTVTTRDGVIYEAKFAIITFSLGVFQKGNIEYVPELPSWKTDVLNSMAFADFMNMYIKFPDGTKPFWDDNLNIVHAHPRMNYYPFFGNIPKIVPGYNLVLATVLDKEAVAKSRQSKKEIIAELDQVFKNLYGDKAVGVEDVFVPDTIVNPSFHGSYSSIPYGITDKTFKAVPAPVGSLFFAGEHTTRELYGYLQGAYLTGIRAGKEVIECHLGKYCASTVYRPHRRPGFYY